MVKSGDIPPHLGEKLAIDPLTRPPRATVRVPGSKSITNRALVLAALSSKGMPCELRGWLSSEDTTVMISALVELGFDVRTRWDEPLPVLTVCRKPGPYAIPARSAGLFTANSGTSMRFLTAMVCLGHGGYRLYGVDRMHQRPIGDLVEAIGQLGVRARSQAGNGCPPVIVEGNGLPGGRARIRGDVSSQFLSGLLLVAPLAQGDVTLEVEGLLVSEPYVAMTVAMMRQWGVQVSVRGRQFHVPGRQTYGIGRYEVEPDASAASYFWAAAAITGGEAQVAGLTPRSLQGDVRFVDVLEEMGCTVIRGETGITVRGGPLRGIDVDMNDISDTVMTLAAVACFAEGPTTIRNVSHIRHKETDRLAALAAELRRVGAEVTEFADGLTITPRPLHGAEIETYNDHRMAMSMALIGLRVPGIVIINPGCVAKTYPHFFTDLERLREEPQEDKS
jgi:3-phosphoshikimate 1-carboxyvinyltransferase